MTEFRDVSELQRVCFEAVENNVFKPYQGSKEPPSSYASPKDVKKCLMKCGVEDKVQVFLFCFLAAFLPIVVPPWPGRWKSTLRAHLRRHPNCQRGFCRSHQQRLEQHSAQCLSEKSQEAAEWCSVVWRFCLWHRLTLTSNDYAPFEVVMCPICMQTRFHGTYQVSSGWRIFWQHRWQHDPMIPNVGDGYWQNISDKRIRLTLFLGLRRDIELQDMEAISGACRQLCQTLNQSSMTSDGLWVHGCSWQLFIKNWFQYIWYRI